MSQFVSYITLDDFKRFFGGLDEQVPHELDTLFKQYIVAASRTVDNYVTNKVRPVRHFHPIVATRNYDYPGLRNSRGSGDLLRLRDDILELTTLTTENGATTISSNDYLLHRWPDTYGRTPYDSIRLQPNGTTTEYSYVNTPYASQTVTGIWGYHDDWANAWEDSQDTVLDDPLTSSATSITVSNADGDDINGLPNRFQTYQLLKIEDEYLWVTAVDTDGDTLTVRRGVCGTTAASHVQTTTIYRYQVMYDIALAMELWTNHLVRRADSIGTPDQRPLAAAQGVLIFPPAMPTEVKDVLVNYRKDAL